VRLCENPLHSPLQNCSIKFALHLQALSICSTMKRKKTIIIADDHTLFREGLRALLSSREDLEIMGEAENGQEAIRSVEEHKPDLLLMDLSMPKMGGLEAIRELKARHPRTKILVLTIHGTEEFVLEALEAGASGYVLKDATHDELVLAIKSVLQEKRYLSPDISAKVIEGYIDGRKTVKSRSAWDSLTLRERQVLKLIAEGRKNKEIADILFISVKTVAKHRANIMGKLDLHNVSALTAYAMERGLIAK
jgi:two-component system response regulator NreC